MKKIELEKLIRDYLGRHYSMFISFITMQILTYTELASGQAIHHISYASLEEDILKYVQPQFIPEDFVFRDLRNFKKKGIYNNFSSM